MQVRQRGAKFGLSYYRGRAMPWSVAQRYIPLNTWCNITAYPDVPYYPAVLSAGNQPPILIQMRSSA